MSWLRILALTLAALLASTALTAGDYDIQVTYPAHDQPIRENTGNVTISVAVAPGLDTDHSIEISMDGTVISRGRGSSVSLSNVDRGTHSVTAVVIDGSGSVVARSDSVSFHMLRAAVGG